jgi:CheY-like chemotaxis protein
MGHTDTANSFRQMDARQPVVLVVEDDPDLRHLSALHLTDFGFEVRAVADGPAAVEVLDGPEPIDLVFTDVILPGMTGYGVADAAVARRPGIKIVFSTGYFGTSASHGQLRHRAAPMLYKPYSRKDLANALHTAFAGA